MYEEYYTVGTVSNTRLSSVLLPKLTDTETDRRNGGEGKSHSLASDVNNVLHLCTTFSDSTQQAFENRSSQDFMGG